MTAPKGTVLEVLYVEGDRYHQRDSNWYWVLLPRDRQGSRVTGWIRGNAVEHVPPPEPRSAPNVSRAEVPQARDARNEPHEAALPASAHVEKVATARPVISEVIVNFQFDKSELTDEARRKLDSAVVRPTSNAPGITVAVEGHTDSTGPDAYNEKLGLARAESVKRYLTQQLGIPAEHISVVSFGENDPVAPNTTREGRARNRRAVIKGGS